MLVFQEWRSKHHKQPPTMDDLRDISTEEASAIYTVQYATPLRFDDLPSGLDYAMLDTAVMEGVRGAITLLQEVLGLKGIMGRYDVRTWDAISHEDPKALALMLTIRHLVKKMHAPSVTKFGPGWSDRIMRRATRIRTMAT